MPATDATDELQEQVRSAARQHSPLVISGSGSKAFLGNAVQGSLLDTTLHQGILSYEPSELVITARAGTPLTEIEVTLSAQSQMLAFEPPHFGPGATLGGTLACGLSGPRRAYAGAAKDFVLGTRIINGKAEVLRFGGEVIKNVAGYDISRLMVGAMGTLGLILEASLKIVPQPEVELTLVQNLPPDQGLALVHSLARRPLPVSATLVDSGQVYMRLSGTHAGVSAARAQLGGEQLDDAAFWIHVREHTHPFFSLPAPLWRLSLPAGTAPPDLQGDRLIEWGGALCWLKSHQEAAAIYSAVAACGGHASRYGDKAQRNWLTQAPAANLLDLHIKTKAAFDPLQIFNPGRLHPAF